MTFVPLTWVHHAAILLGCRIAVKPYLKERGRFSLGKWSGPVTWIAFIWSVIAVCIFTMPTVWPIEGKKKLSLPRQPNNMSHFVTASTFNYSAVALLGAIMTTMMFWCGWGRDNYIGPRDQNENDHDVLM